MDSTDQQRSLDDSKLLKRKTWKSKGRRLVVSARMKLIEAAHSRLHYIGTEVDWREFIAGTRHREVRRKTDPEIERK